VIQNDWIALLCFMAAKFGISMGIQSVPFILASEYFPTAIRPVVSCFYYSVFL